MNDELATASDEDLVRRVLTGDETAARSLFGRYESLLHARTRRRLVGGVRRKLGASDVVQETYLAVFEDLARFEDRGPGSFRRWLETVHACREKDEVRRHAGAQKRSARREVSQEPGASRSGPAAPQSSPSAVAAAAEERDILWRAIAGMEGDDRAVLELVHRDGRDFAQAGLALGRSADAARKLYARAVRRLGARMRRSP
jgi:RNA polymerase sigma-70 factor (ECF subfamily)